MCSGMRAKRICNQQKTGANQFAACWGLWSIAWVAASQVSSFTPGGAGGGGGISCVGCRVVRKGARIECGTGKQGVSAATGTGAVHAWGPCSCLLLSNSTYRETDCETLRKTSALGAHMPTQAGVCAQTLCQVCKRMPGWLFTASCMSCCCCWEQKDSLQVSLCF